MQIDSFDWTQMGPWGRKAVMPIKWPWNRIIYFFMFLLLNIYVLFGVERVEQTLASYLFKLSITFSTSSSGISKYICIYQILQCLPPYLVIPEHHFRKILLECCCLCSLDDRRVTIQIDPELCIQLVPRIPHSVLPPSCSYDHYTTVRKPSLTELQDHYYSLCLPSSSETCMLEQVKPGTFGKWKMICGP
jgi:hypothetical protein